MKKLLIGTILTGVIILNLSNILTLGLKAYDKIGTDLGICTVEAVEVGSELIYNLENIGL